MSANLETEHNQRDKGTVDKMNDYQDFNSFKSLLKLQGIIKNLTQTHVGGSSLEMGIGENSVFKQNIGGIDLPVIPGTSLKGVLRTEAEKLVGNGNSCEPPNTSNMCKEDNYCPVCGIFGGNSLASHVKVLDLIPTEDDVPTSQKPGVAIHRVLGVAYPGAKYEIEVIEPENEYFFDMFVENIKFNFEEKLSADKNDIRSKIILYLLKKMALNQISVGGKTSGGLGVLKLSELTATYYTKVEGEFEPKEEKYTVTFNDDINEFEVKKNSS